jgi:hypothetical protein
MNNILINKKQLDDYISDFHPDKKIEILEKFNNFNFDCGRTSFLTKMKKIISMPKFGKRTIIYWISRGWSEKDALEKRIPDNKDPETSPMNINFWMKRGYSKSDAEFEIKSRRKTNKEYWIKRGFSEADSLQKVIEFQKTSNSIFIQKINSDINYRESVNSKRTNNLKYWINLGYSEDESIKKVSERQSTFSLKKCLDKYGIEGHKIWQDRQVKWQKSLALSHYNGKDKKDSKTIEFFKKKYPENWIDQYFNKISFKEKDDIMFLTSFENYKDLIDSLIVDKWQLSEISYILRYKIISEIYNCSDIDMFEYLHLNYEKYSKTPDYYHKNYPNWIDKFIKDNSYKDENTIRNLLNFKDYKEMIIYMIDNYRITDINIYLQSKLISYFYKTTHKEMFNFLVNSEPTIKSKYGHIRYFNNHICRSDAEFLLAKFLIDNNIKYEYEKKYENTLKRYDFYLNDFDFYIEYTGMQKNSICNTKYKEKQKFCLDNNINCIFSNNIKEIKTKILDEIKFNNRTTE